MDYPFLVNGGKPCGDEKDTQSVLFHGRETQSGCLPRGKASTPAARLTMLAPKRKANGNDAAAETRATLRRLKSQLAAAQARIADLEASADTDFLLGVLNRRGFERELHRSIAYIRRYHASGALIVLDVDRLKPINDAFGHAAGDAVLKAVVAALSRHVRSSDLIGRLGGDEFALLLWNLSETDARAKAIGARRDHRPADLHFPWTDDHGRRIGWRRHPRTACRRGHGAGAGRQRDVHPEGAAARRLRCGRASVALRPRCPSPATTVRAPPTSLPACPAIRLPDIRWP